MSCRKAIYFFSRVKNMFGIFSASEPKIECLTPTTDEHYFCLLKCQMLTAGQQGHQSSVFVQADTQYFKASQFNVMSSKEKYPPTIH